MKTYLKGLILFISCFSLLVACSPSKKEAAEETQKAVNTVFNEKSLPTNAKALGFKFYKPDDLEIKKNGTNNVILQDSDDNLYILFVNSNEDPQSQLNFKIDQKQKAKGDVIKSFNIKDHFVYVYVKQLENEQYELVVGEGGVKMSTKTSLKHLADEAEKMGKIVHSVVY